MKHLYILLMGSLIACLFPSISLAQTVKQSAIVCKVTHKANDPVVPIPEVQVVVNGVASPQSNAQGQVILPISLNAERSYQLEALRLPKNSRYILAWPQQKEKLFVSKNVQRIALITPEERDQISKEQFDRLMRNYQKENQRLLALQKELRNTLQQMERNESRYQTTAQRLDSVENEIKRYFNDDNRKNVTRQLKKIAMELAMTDYQSLDSLDARVFEMKQKGDWKNIVVVLNELMKGDARGYLHEGLEKKQQAEKLARQINRDVAKHFKKMEEAIEAFRMQHINDSVAHYYQILLESAPDQWNYWFDAGDFALLYLLDREEAIRCYSYPLEHAIEDSIRMEAHLHLADLHIYYQHYAPAKEHYEKAEELLYRNRITKSAFAAKLFNRLATIYLNEGHNEKALEFGQRSLDLLQKYASNDAYTLAETYNLISVVYEQTGQFDAALQNARQALNVLIPAEERPLKSFISATLFNTLGNIYNNLGETETAIEYIEKGLRLRIHTFGENNPEVACSYMGLGLCCSKKTPEQAIGYLEKAYSIFMKTTGGRHGAIRAVYSLMGRVYEENQAYEKAIAMYQKCMEGFEKSKDQANIAHINFSIGYLYQKTGNDNKAEKYFKEAEKLFLNQQYPPYGRLYEIYLYKGALQLDKDVKEAIRCYEKAAEYAQLDRKIENVISTKNIVALLYFQNKRFKESAKTFSEVLGTLLKNCPENKKDILRIYQFTCQAYLEAGDKIQAQYYIEQLKTYIQQNHLEKVYQELLK